MAARDDLDTLRARHDELADELKSLRAERRRLEEVTERTAALEDEVAALREQLEATQKKRSLPVLDDLRIASPCSEKWDEMVGDERQRFCLKCDKTVYDVSAMTRAEALALIAAAEGKDELCLRLYRRHDGTVLTADCPVGVRRRRVTRFAAAAAVFGGAAAALAASATAPEAQGMHLEAPTIDPPIDLPAEPYEEPAKRYDPHAKPPGRHVMGGIKRIPPNHPSLRGTPPPIDL